MTVAILTFLGHLIAFFLLGSMPVSSEHSDLPMVQHFTNALWLWYVDHIFPGVS